MSNFEPLTTSLIICEKVLNEVDTVLSAIRIADTYLVPEIKGVPTDRQVVYMSLLVALKFPTSDDSVHTFGLMLTRPDGSETKVDLGMPMQFDLKEIPQVKVKDAPHAINVVSTMGVKATHMGVHWLKLFVDDKEVAASIFRLARPENQPS
jgi:hypothetical protein